MPTWLTIQAAAEELSCSESTIRRMVRDGQIKMLRVRGLVRVQLPSPTEPSPKKKRRHKGYRPKMFRYPQR